MNHAARMQSRIIGWRKMGIRPIKKKNVDAELEPEEMQILTAPSWLSVTPFTFSSKVHCGKVAEYYQDKIATSEIDHIPRTKICNEYLFGYFNQQERKVTYHKYFME